MKLKIGIYLILFLIFLLSSCTRYKNIVYLQDKDKANGDSIGFYPQQVPDYKIQNRDILYIRIISMNREVTDVMNTTPYISANMFNSESNLYIYGYNVNDSGYVEIPVVGRVKVVDMNLEEAKKAIIKQTLKYLKDPTVIVKLISFKFSVFGEVNRPGSYVNYNNQLTVLEAISQAGNVSQYSNMRKVMVVRTEEKGTKTIRLDLTDRNILQSEGYYLLPNDVVYVEPMKSRNFRNNIPTLSLFLGAVTTFILVLNYVNPK